jgi:hypothetical protein
LPNNGLALGGRTIRSLDDRCIIAGGGVDGGGGGGNSVGGGGKDELRGTVSYIIISGVGNES